MSAPLRVGVLGVGRIGAMHAALLAGQVDGAALAGVADALPEAAGKAARSLGVAPYVPEALIADPSIDAVAICTPTDSHVELIVAAAAAGKAIFCEKPLSLDLGEVDRALEAARRADAFVMVGFNRRYDPAHRAVQQAVASGSTGAVHLLRITSRDPAPPPVSYVKSSGGLFLDMTIHDFDMARYVAGSEVVEVFAKASVRISPEIESLGDVDTAVVTLEHENGCFSVIDNSRQATYGYDQRVEVLGASGLAASENPLAHTAVTADGAGFRAAVLPNFFIERYRLSYLHQWQALVEAYATGEEPPTSGADGRAALVLGLCAKASLERHATVRVEEFAAIGH